jgi:hypothetical protein
MLAVVERVTRTSRRWWVLNAADNAAFALNSPNRYAIWVDRLTESGMADDAMQRLVNLIEGTSGSGWNGNVTPDMAPVQRLWRQFLAAHAAQIRAGRKFAAGEGDITADMIPVNMTLTVNGRSWPARP